MEQFNYSIVKNVFNILCMLHTNRNMLHRFQYFTLKCFEIIKLFTTFLFITYFLIAIVIINKGLFSVAMGGEGGIDFSASPEIHIPT